MDGGPVKKKRLEPQYEKEKFERPGTTFSNLSNKVAVPTVKDTKTAVALPHCSESAKESITG